MKKKRKIDAQKSAIKKVAKSGSQEIEKHVTKKRERGITLIALVVTIIIMLILAAVTLNMALGDNGLIQMAKLATNKYEQAAINESLAMQELEEAFPKTAKDLTKDNYGDYVDYGLDLSGDGDYTNDWRIFYVGGEDDGAANGRIFLIAADYVPNKCDALKAAQIKAKMITPSNNNYKLCSSYWSYSDIPEYHCNDGRESKANKDKDQCSFPEIFMPSGSFCEKDNHYYCSSHVGNDGKGGNENSRCASALQCTANWESFVKESGKSDCANYAIGGPTLEMWVASWNQKHGTDAEEGEKTLYANGKGDNNGNSGYYVGTTVGCTTDRCDVKEEKGYNDTLYFPHTTSGGLDLFEDKKTGDTVKDVDENASSLGYWLSSPSAHGTKYLMTVNCVDSVGSYSYNIDFGVRPVISLKFNVKLTKRNETSERVVYDINM